MAKQVKKIDLIENDVFSDLRSSAQTTEAVIISLETSLKAVSTMAKQMKSVMPKDSPVNSKGIAELNTQQQKANELAKLRQQIDKDLIKEKIRLSEINKEQNALLKTEIALENKQIGTLEKLTLENKQLTNERKKLNLETKEGNNRLKEINRQLDLNNQKLNQNSDKLGKQRLNIGNYGSALNGLKGSLMNIAGAFGLAFGGVQIFKNGLQTVSEFETQIADLSAVTGQTGKDLDFLKEKSIDFSKRFGESASSIAEAFKIAGSARPELLKNGQAMADLTEKAIILSKASGDDIPTSIANLTGTLNAFDMPATMAGKVMDTLANAAQLGAQEIPYLTEAFTKFGGIAANAGVGVAESAAAIEILGKKIPEASIAGNNMKNILTIMQIEASKAKRPFKGLTAELELLKPRMNDVTFLAKTYTKENLLAIQTLIGQTDAMKTMTGQLDKNGTALEQANTKSATLAEAGKRLKETWNGFILEMANGRGVASGFTKTLDFLTNNFDTIISTLGYVIKGFIAFKVAMFALKMQERYKDFKAFNSAAKETGANLSDAEKSGKGFGNALKGAGMAIAIALLTELALKFWDVVSGAEAARKQAERMGKANDKAAKTIAAVTQRTKDWVTEQKRLLDLELRERLKNGESAKKIDEERILREKKIESIGLNRIKYAQKIRKEEYAEKVQDFERLQALAIRMEDKGRFASVSKTDLEVLKKYGATSSSDFFTKREKILSNLSITTTALTQEIVGLNKSEKEYNDLIDESNVKIGENTSEINMNHTEKKKETKAIKANIVALEREDEVRQSLFDTDKLEQVLLLDEERAVLAAEILVIEAEIALKKEQQSGNQKAINEAEKSLINAKKILIDKQLAYDLAAGNGNVNSEDKLKKQAELDKLNLDNTEEVSKKTFEIERKFLKLTEDIFTKNIDKKIAKIDEEIEAHKKRATQLEELANNGNITAQQSLAKELQMEADAQIKREKLEKRKQAIQTVGAFLTSYSNALESGKKGWEALATASADQAVLDGFISALPAFLEGAEDTGTVANPLDANGGRLAVIHDNERILTKEHNNLIGSMTNAELVSRIQLSKILPNQTMQGWENAQIIAELNGLKSEIKEVTNAIKSQPQQNIELGAITAKSMEIVHTIKKGGQTTNNTFRIS